MGRLARWCLAGTVTIVVFVAVTWVSGAFVLPHLMRSADIRWLVAASLGVAVAALAALWGHSFATGDASAAVVAGRTVTASGERSIAVGGDVSGTVSTGDRKSGSQPSVVDGAGAAPLASPGTIPASERRSIAADGSISGPASNNDDVDGPRP
jgi:hypothetical protein